MNDFQMSQLSQERSREMLSEADGNRLASVAAQGTRGRLRLLVGAALHRLPAFGRWESTEWGRQHPSS